MFARTGWLCYSCMARYINSRVTNYSEYAVRARVIRSLDRGTWPLSPPCNVRSYQHSDISPYIQHAAMYVTVLAD